jgi:hypothetical protein
MTTPSIDKIGLVYDYSKQGEWALSAALNLGRTCPAALNVYYFLESPYSVPRDVAPAKLPVRCYDSATLIREERKLREHFEDRLGDFEDVRFRVCESGRHNRELRRCLLHREYRLLIIPHLRAGTSFGNMPIEEFAYRFAAPVLLVGPDREDQFSLNRFAAVVDGSRPLGFGAWRPIAEPAQLQTQPVL